MVLSVISLLLAWETQHSFSSRYSIWEQDYVLCWIRDKLLQVINHYTYFYFAQCLCESEQIALVLGTTVADRA